MVLLSTRVWPVSLPSPLDVFSTSSQCWVTGWGMVAANKPLGGQKTLQQLKATCRQSYPQTSENQLCAGYLEGGKGTCKGDSGGALVCKTSKGFIQVGVVSFGLFPCDQYGYPTVFTRVQNYIQFIKSSIRKYN